MSHFPGPSSHPSTSLTGCGLLELNPTLTLQPEASSASTPSALNVGVSMPQQGLTQPEGQAESAIEQTTVTLPAGLQLSPAAANGLQDCSAAAFDFRDPLGQLFAGAEEEQQTSNLTSPSGAPHCPERPRGSAPSAFRRRSWNTN